MKKLSGRGGSAARIAIAILFSGVAGAVGGGLSGCASWMRKPVDLQAHLEQWRAATVEHDDVRVRAGQEHVGFDASNGLDRVEATLVALVFNPDVRIARLKAGALAAAAGHAGAWDNPQLGLELGRVLQSVGDPWVLRASIGFTIPLSGRLSAARDQAAARVDVARREALLAEWALRERVTRAFVAWSTAARKAKLLDGYLATVSNLVTVAGALGRAGEVPPEAVGVLPLEHAERAVERDALQAESRLARHRLLALLGLAPGAPVEFAVEASPSPAALPTALPEQLRLARERHPAVHLALARHELAEQTVRREVAKQFPDLQLGPATELDAGQSTIGLAFGLPIPMLNLNREGIAQARGDREVARAQAEAVLQSLAAELALAQTTLDAATARLAAVTGVLVPMVEAQQARLEDLAQQGEIDPLLIVHVLQRSLAARLAQVDAERTQNVAQERVRWLLGPEPMEVSP